MSDERPVITRVHSDHPHAGCIRLDADVLVGRRIITETVIYNPCNTGAATAEAELLEKLNNAVAKAKFRANREDSK